MSAKSLLTATTSSAMGSTSPPGSRRCANRAGFVFHAPPTSKSGVRYRSPSPRADGPEYGPCHRRIRPHREVLPESDLSRTMPEVAKPQPAQRYEQEIHFCMTSDGVQ